MVSFRSGQWRMLAITWAAYVAFNVTRKVTSVVKRRLQLDLSLSPYELGALDTSFLCAYTLGQFINGPLGDRIGAKMMVTVGLLGSAATTYLSGTATSASMLVVLSFLHGGFQSGAFSACVKSLTPWLSSFERGTKMGFWSTCSPVGGIVGTALAASILGAYGWRAAFLYTGPMLALVALLCFTLFLESPRSIGLRSADEECSSSAGTSAVAAVNLDASAVERKPPRAAKQKAPAMSEVIRLPGMLWLALGYFFLKFMRYTLLFWLPFYHAELGYDDITAGYLSTTFEIGGVFGTMLIGWVSDRFLDGRRTLASMWMMVAAAFVLVAYMAVGSTSTFVSAPLMALVGVLLLGPDSVMSGTICQDLAQRSPHGSSVVGTVTGIVNGCGSVGSIVQGFATAAVSAWYGWDAVFYMLIAFSLVTALALVPAVRIEKQGLIDRRQNAAHAL